MLSDFIKRKNLISLNKQAIEKGIEFADSLVSVA